MAYTAIAGDSLSKIARDNGTTVADIMAANPDITDANVISVGQVIQLPGEAAEETPAEEGAVDDPLAAKVAENFPSYAYLLDHPEIGPLLREAVDEDTGMSAQMFTSKVKETRWYRETSDSQRKWDALQQLDPATAARQLAAEEATVQRIFSQMGAQGSAEDVRRVATASLRNGFDDVQRLDAIAGHVTWSPTMQAGTAGANLRSILSLADEYLLPKNVINPVELARKLTTGQLDEAGIEQQIVAAARDIYAGNEQIAAHLDAGGSMQGLWEPRRQTIASLYGTSAEDVRWDDNRWAKVINNVDDAGKTRMMDVADTRKHVMDRDDWAMTDQGQAFAMDIGRGISEWMGRV